MCARKQVVTADDVQSERHVLGRLVVPVVHTLVTLVQHNVCCLVKALEHALLCARRDESSKKESIGHLPHVAAPMCAHVCVRVCKPPSHVRRWSRPKPVLSFPITPHPSTREMSSAFGGVSYVCVCVSVPQTLQVRFDEEVCHSVSSRARTLNDRNEEQETKEEKRENKVNSFQTTEFMAFNNWFCLFSLVGRARCL